jgi:hypothetical protein
VKKEKMRKQYKKPEISHVSLAMDEVVLAGCKMSQGDPAGKGNKYCGHGQCKKYMGS